MSKLPASRSEVKIKFMEIRLKVVAVVNFIKVTLGTSQNTHDISVASVLRTSMDFFYENPIGRILNRFTKDTDVLDDDLPNQTDNGTDHYFL